jgi:hypothetical protein
VEDAPPALAGAEEPTRREGAPPTLRLRAPLDHPSGRTHCEPAVHVANSNVVVAEQRVSAGAVELRVGGGCRRPARPREDNNRKGYRDQAAHAPHRAAGVWKVPPEMHFKSRPTSRSWVRIMRRTAPFRGTTYIIGRCPDFASPHSRVGRIKFSRGCSKSVGARLGGCGAIEQAC